MAHHDFLEAFPLISGIKKNLFTLPKINLLFCFLKRLLSHYFTYFLLFLFCPYSQLQCCACPASKNVSDKSSVKTDKNEKEKLLFEFWVSVDFDCCKSCFRAFKEKANGFF